MDMWIHFLVGVIIQKSVFNIISINYLSWFLIIIISFFSHWVVDWGSYITFHPDETYLSRNPDDKFNKIRLILSTIYPIAILIYFTFITNTNYIFVMFVAWSVDFVDWIVIRNLVKIGKIDQKYNQNGILHPYINKTRERLLPFLPNWREKKWAYAIEYLISIPLVTTAVILTI